MSDEGQNTASKTSISNDQLRQDIERFYLPRQLVNAITEIGAIPNNSEEAIVGIGFLDIADYTFLSKFLSPNENQTVLNGLYSAFNWVLNKHGGYLNKLEGDSLMFQYGGPIDPNVRGLSEPEAEHYIARELFYTCIELQRVCILFNQANDKFLYSEKESKTKEEILKAFDIIRGLRNNEFLSPSINALFQIRIRIGASIGKVMIGNFGPEGSKHWDVIGMPVINAKRMESTAPVGGVRISEEYYRQLEKQGIVESYFQRFTREASALFSVYKSIKKEELFRFNSVYIKEKNNAGYHTYSVQVEPNLPEEIVSQVELLLQKEEPGAQRIIDFLKYYRGNQYVIQKLEELFDRIDITLRKDALYNILLPRRYQSMLDNHNGDEAAVAKEISVQYNLKALMDILGDIQDAVKHPGSVGGPQDFTFIDYDSYIKVEKEKLLSQYDYVKDSIAHTSFFYNLIFPMFFAHIKTSLLEYQNRIDELEEL
ncbi:MULTISPECIES: adenylate/guanylate cyclase domain-containing protein [unclassified Oceanispirochaeta]|uniref:adenylate/guanylate cyclase domain-containing protein n=1 Tax=unclassified Oceanispirochaeta TaxID=2635722 RepID=UPI000E08E2AE|nr:MULTISPECIES: adenylate/guanylate cyclase domain-containing protein [unclassified Oceanispirochaeta]MBF9016243.1 adenylate/guanylate cyclase domain-containing protein [Oceanispirochaeta sp. M2]NPD72705.1 adenylate/guanylate cyclase domain-containing protein [Oceanispirochaeta sp. M1]RDG31853.1 adenylate/guanylate cyclase domain-containing protein [Oceanispirochaeta sp. M1]